MFIIKYTTHAKSANSIAKPYKHHWSLPLDHYPDYNSAASVWQSNRTADSH